MINATRDLVTAARAGDAQAVGDLLIVCQPDLKRFARRMCATAEDAEDAVQIALWQLYRKIGGLRTVATFATWLFRIVERECYRLFRRGPPPAVAAGSAGESITAPAVPVDLHLDLARAIAALPAPYREVLILRDIDELTAPEVAAELGLTVQAVKSRLHRARAMMKERLVASGYWTKDGEIPPEHAQYKGVGE